MGQGFVRPAKETNAIDQAVLTLAFNRMLQASDVSAAKQVIDSLANELPGVMTEESTISVHFGPANMPPPAPPYGRFAAAKDGAHAWRLQLFPNMLQVMCTNYTSSREVMPKMQNFAEKVLLSLPDHVGVTEIGLNIVDKFLYDMSQRETEYNIKFVFSDKTPYLTEKARQSGEQWHVHQGWFEDNNGAYRILNQLNLSSVKLPDSALSTFVDHRCLVQFSTDNQPAVKSITGDPLQKFTTKLKKRNTEIIKHLLNADMLAAIGMK